MTTYESILNKLLQLQRSPSAEERSVEWVTPSAVVGLSRTAGGRVEIFLAGPKLKAHSSTVRSVLEYQTWHRAKGEPSITANRILLPKAGHFDQVAAFLCAEIFRSGSDLDLARAFRVTEPIIELAIAKLRLTDQALLGLNGELLLLDAMLRQTERGDVKELIVAWYGWRESTRDFSRNSVGIEVKTTTRAVSTHQVQGVHQLELLDHSDSGDSEHKLFLVSIGLEWVDADGDIDVDREHFYTLPRLVESIVQQARDAIDELAAEEVVEAFISQVFQYGEDHDIGYDHHAMSGSAAYSRPFIQRFVRCYDMLDPGIEVLRSADLIPLRHVSRGSVRFQIELPSSIHGDLNPVVGLNATAKLVVEASRGR